MYRVSQPPVHVARVLTGCVHPNIFIPKVDVQARKPVHVDRRTASFSCRLLPTLLPLLGSVSKHPVFPAFCRFHSCPEDSMGLWRVEKGVRPKELQESGCCSFSLSSSWSLHPIPAHESGRALYEALKLPEPASLPAKQDHPTSLTMTTRKHCACRLLHEHTAVTAGPWEGEPGLLALGMMVPRPAGQTQPFLATQVRQGTCPPAPTNWEG